MSRRSFSNQEELISIVNRCRNHATEKSHRALIVIEMAPEYWLQQLAHDFSIAFILASNETDRSDQIAGVLGSEQSLVIHQLADKFDTGLFAALAGTIKAGGVLVLGTSGTTRNHLFWRFHRILELLSGRYPDLVVQAAFKPASGEHQDALGVSFEEPAMPTKALIQLQAKQEQDHLFAIACKFLDQHQKACILITGRRGRGKSGLLARLASWLRQNRHDFKLTAANQAGLSTIFDQCRTARDSFVSPDNASVGMAKTLLVDEAGSLPLATLQKFLQSYEQVIFCTTVEGYEIGGRAFDVRFAPQVRDNYSHVLDLQPIEPWRWARTDPLEQLLDQLLLTDHASLTQDLTVAAGPPERSPATPALIGQAELAQDEHRLHSLFTLFRNTHYQTSTQDLEHLLDSPDIRIWVIEQGQIIVAAVLVTLEGQIAPDLHEAVVSKARRLPHQLLPQLLAQCANTPDALAIPYARVIRISVLDSLRRAGMASRLIQCIEAHLLCDHNRSMAMGASFAADHASIAFWQANGYTEFHRGFRPNPRTGKNAVAMIKAWGSTITEVVNSAALIHADNNQVRKRIAHSPVTQTVDEPKQADFALLTRFAANQRSVNDTLGPLARLASRHDFPLLVQANQNRRQYEQSLRKIVADLLTDWS